MTNATRTLTEQEIAEGYELLVDPENIPYNPARYDFVWSDDFLAFRAIKLLWWDDASYIAYQSDPGCDGMEDARDWQENATPEELEEAARQSAEITALIMKPRANFDDELPF